MSGKPPVIRRMATHPLGHGQFQHRVPGEHAEHADDRPQRRVPQQNAPADQPARFRQEEGQEDEPDETDKETHALADGDPGDQ